MTVLVDASASVTRVRPTWSSWVRRQLARVARDAAGGGEDIIVVEYAADVARAFGPADAEALEAELEGHAGTPWLPGSAVASRELGTALAAALEIARGVATEPARAPGSRVLVLGSRSFTGDDPAPALARLAGRRGSSSSGSSRPPPSSPTWRWGA